MNILEISNLSISFKNKDNVVTKVLNNISFVLEKSKTLGIVGESGSGKSITVLSILRLLPPNAVINSGTIKFIENNKEINLLHLVDKEMLLYRGNSISMIFQEPMTSLNPSLKCGYQVLEVLTTHCNTKKKKARQRVLELFNEVKLPDPLRIFNSYPHEISGGQKQRVMIAMAIILKPSILIADEPTTALDVTVQKTILELLKQIQVRYKMSIIFITHDLGVVSQIADDIVVMHKGQIVEKGDTSQILLRPKHPYTKGLLKCRPDLNYTNDRLPVLNDFLNTNTENTNQTILKKRLNGTREKENRILLRVSNLHKDYFSQRNIFRKSKQQKALLNVNFEVYKGETLGLVGESGSGKTTLGRIIVQLIEQTSGSIEYNGVKLKDLIKKDLKQFRKNIQFVFQDPYSSLNPKLTIGNILMEPLLVHGLEKSKTRRKERIFELLNKVKLDEDTFFKYPHEFSGGQRQRIVIARALALNPEFIILDEPVSALDVSVQAEILNLLNDLKEEYKLTYIFISHDLSVVRYMADRIMVVKEGELVEIDKAEKIYMSPASEYTKKLIESIPFIKSN